MSYSFDLSGKLAIVTGSSRGLGRAMACALAQAGAGGRGQNHYRAMFDATASTDRLIELILEEDKDVFRQLLTTDRVVVSNTPGYSGQQYSQICRNQ